MPTSSAPSPRPPSRIEPGHRLALATLAKRTLAARENLGAFVETVVKNETGAPMVLAPIHRAWMRHVEFCWRHDLRAIVVAPFGHGKTLSVVIPIIAWNLGRDPNLRVKIVTNEDDAAMRRLGAVRKIIESMAYRRVFPDVKQGTKWTEHELYLERPGQSPEPSVQSKGVLATGIGTRADILVFDDVVDQKNSRDPIQRQKILSLLEETWMSRLEPHGTVIYVGTLWHNSDATHNLIQRSGWCTLLQRVADDCESIEQELIGCPFPADYPAP